MKPLVAPPAPESIRGLPHAKPTEMGWRAAVLAALQPVSTGFASASRRFQSAAASLVAPLLALLLFAALLAGCAAVAPPSPVGSCTLGLPADVSDKDAITGMLRAEGELVVVQRIDDLMALWGEGASITDAKHTPDDNGDDQDWLGKDAIRHRYVRTVFPGAPAQANPADLQIAFTGGDRAVVTATTHIGGEVAPAGDRWTLVRRDGCWLLQNLTYNLEP